MSREANLHIELDLLNVERDDLADKLRVATEEWRVWINKAAKADGRAVLAEETLV